MIIMDYIDFFSTEGYLVFNSYFNLIVQKFRGVMKTQIELLRSHLTTISPSGRGPSLCWAIRLVGLVLTFPLCSHQEIKFSIIGTTTHNTDVPK